MSLVDVRKVYVVQDKQTGAFVDINMSLVMSFRNAARAVSPQISRESMDCALQEGQITCPDGYEVHTFYELTNECD